MALRLRAMGARGYENGFDLSLMPNRLDEPLRRKKPRVYFVNSMSDLFHEEVPDDYLDRVFDVMTRPAELTQNARLGRPWSLTLVPARCPLGRRVSRRPTWPSAALFPLLGQLLGQHPRRLLGQHEVPPHRDLPAVADPQCPR